MTDLRPRIVLYPFALLIAASACSKPRAFAPTDDFVRRHGCPAKSVETMKEGSDRVRVSGCGQIEVYVNGCANRSATFPPPTERRPPVSESEARFSSESPSPHGVGCAWSREPPHDIPPGLPGGE